MAIAVLLLASSCSTYRTNSRPDDIDAGNVFGESVELTDTSTIAAIPWREFFTDSRLQALIHALGGGI